MTTEQRQMAIGVGTPLWQLLYAAPPLAPRRGRPRSGVDIRTCEQCGGVYQSYNKAQRFCSKSCARAGTAHLAAPHPILVAMQQRWPCAAVPRGTYTALGAEFGVTRERVRQIATKHGLTVALVDPLRMPNGTGTNRACAKCGAPIGKYGRNTFCRECRWIDLPCTQCGKPKHVLASSISNRTAQNEKRIANGNAPYTGRVFCDRHCFAVWFGLNYGTGTRDMSAYRKPRATGPRIPQHGTVREYAQFKCHCDACNEVGRAHYRERASARRQAVAS